MTRLSVIGTGYLGVTHAVCMASLGHSVIALDVDAEKISSLSAGVVPFHEPELPEMLESTLASGKLAFTTDFSQLAEQADVHFLCVGTPQSGGSDAADLSQIRAAVAALAPLLKKPCLVVGKSTVPVGTAKWISEYLIENSPAGSDVHLVWNPEFLREGFAVQDTLRPDRVVLGALHDVDVTLLKDVYADALANETPLIVSDYATAELVKVAANAFLATKISFINAFADLADVVGADVSTLADAIGHDTRIGRRFLNAGIGFGGCIILATHLPAELTWWSYSLFILGFAIAGLGSSFVAPSFFAAANRRSKLPSAVVVGQFGVINTVLTFAVKWIVAWTIQFTGSIALAMMIPAALMLATFFFASSLNQESTKNS